LESKGQTNGDKLSLANEVNRKEQSLQQEDGNCKKSQGVDQDKDKDQPKANEEDGAGTIGICHEPPPLDEEKMKMFDESKAITSLIKDLRSTDDLGASKPLRDCIRPNYGVTYREGKDEQRNLGSIELAGSDVYQSPEFRSRMRRQDLQDR